MKEQHVKALLLGFINQELPSSDRHFVGEHLLHCESCRREHDELKFGAKLASMLSQHDAPANMWSEIGRAIDREPVGLSLIPQVPWFSFKKAMSTGLALVVVGIFTVAVYRGLFVRDTTTVTTQPPAAPSAQHQDFAQVDVPQPSAVNANIPTSSQNDPIPQPQVPAPSNDPQVYWQVDTLAGAPTIEAGSGGGDKLTVGASLVTDASSRAKVEVADIGSVEIAPNSRVRLVGTNKQQHRLSLERGQLHAKIAAPPRLFIVDTPSAAAVDLGCEYTLEVDKAGNSRLNVKTGYVALERGGRESIVPAGASCLTRNGKGLGTPFSTEATPEFLEALGSFDFERGGSRAVKRVIDQAGFYDIITLWHLLSRVGPKDRETVFDKLAKYVPPPTGVSRNGIMRLDRTMLEKWRQDVESAWFS